MISQIYSYAVYKTWIREMYIWGKEICYHKGQSWKLFSNIHLCVENTRPLHFDFTEFKKFSAYRRRVKYCAVSTVVLPSSLISTFIFEIELHYFVLFCLLFSFKSLIISCKLRLSIIRNILFFSIPSQKLEIHVYK